MATHDLLTNSLAVRNPNPLNLIPYSYATGDTCPEGEDAYITYFNIHPSTHVPGIPSPYSQEQFERRALYICGVPTEWQTKAFRRIFENFGIVEKCPIIIDLKSNSTFRFVIMETMEQCLRARDLVHGFVLEKHTLYTSEALPSSSLLELKALNPDDLRLFKMLVANASSPQIEVEDEDEDEIQIGNLDLKNDNAALHNPYMFGSGTLDQASTSHRHPSPPLIKLPNDEIHEASSSEVELQPTTRKHRPAPLNLTYTNHITSRRVSPFSLPSQSPFPKQGHFPPISETSELTSTEILDSLTPTPTQETFKAKPWTPVVNTWSAIVKAASPSQSNVNLQSSPPRSGRRLHSVGRIPEPNIKPKVIPASTLPYEHPSHQQRVVLILNIPHTITLSQISNAIHEGPVVCIRFGYDTNTAKKYAGIVFQYAADAEKFYNILLQERESDTPSRFRFIADAVRGDPFPLNTDILAMGHPTYASRRLTIVKKAFFFAFTGRNLQTLCEKEVGRDNVQLVFVYNGGNATVVFAEVAASIQMKERLELLRLGAGKEGGTSSIYEGLQVSFSKDPCELEGGLNLQAAEGWSN